MLMQGIFENWKRDFNDLPVATRFLASTRQEVLEDLAFQLAEKNIPLEEAERLIPQLKKCLITKNARDKQTKEYKSWPLNVEADYKRIVVSVYEGKGLLTAPTQIRCQEIEAHPLIDLWGSQKFGDAWCNELKQLANVPDSSLHNMFLDEFFI